MTAVEPLELMRRYLEAVRGVARSHGAEVDVELVDELFAGP